MDALLDELTTAGLDTRFGIDVASVATGVRPRGLLHYPSVADDRITELLRRLQLLVVAKRNLYRTRDTHSREGILSQVPWPDSSSELWHELWFANRDAPSVDSESLFASPGHYLGYPDCCVEAMLRSRSLSTFYATYLFATRPRSWRLNRLTTLFSKRLMMPDFFPCSLACTAAEAFVAPFFEIGSQTFGIVEAGAWEKEARAAYFLNDGYLYQAIAWRITDEGVVVDLGGIRSIALQSIAEIEMPKAKSRLLEFTHLVLTDGQTPEQVVIEKEGEKIAIIKLDRREL